MEKKTINKDNVNYRLGFDDTTEHEKLFAGKNQYICEFCGCYNASKPRCNKCEREN